MEKLHPDVEKNMQERFGHDNVMALATVDGGEPQVRYVNAYYEDGSFYVITYALSGKMRQIGKHPAVALAGEWFTARGVGESLGFVGKADNLALTQKLRQVFSAWIDNGHTNFADENTVILRVRLTSGVLFAHGTRHEFTLE